MSKRILISFGRFPRDRPAADLDRATEVARTIGQKLAKEDVVMIYPGNKYTTASIAAKTFLDEIPEQSRELRLITYLPRMSYEERDDRSLKYEGLGQALVLDDWVWQRRERMVRNCDAMLLMGGVGGCGHNVSLAHLYRKPIIAIPQFGGIAYLEFGRITNELERKNDKETLQMIRAVGNHALNSVEIAGAAVRAAIWISENRAFKRTVFIAMPFGEDYKDNHDVEDAIRETVKLALGWKTVVLRDIEIGSNKALTEILPEQIRNSSIVIIDLNNSRPNVYYEAGLAHGFARPTIFLAREGTEVHFDVASHERIAWKNFRELKSRLHDWLQQAADRA